MSHFFDKDLSSGRRVEVIVQRDRVLIDTDADATTADSNRLLPAAALTSAEAKQLGRSLIKAGKFLEKTKDHVPTDPRLSHDD